MKKEENRNNSNKKRGLRLKECRKLRNLTQEELSERLNFSTNYLSMLERGERNIDWDKAKIFAEELNVSPAYIMCESDIAEKNHSIPITDIDTFGDNDLRLIKYIITLGYTLTFHVRKLYEDREPITKEFYGKKIPIYKSLEYDLSIEQISEFCLSDYHCLVHENDTFYEAIIIAVTINNTRLSYGLFVFTINRIIDYLRFTFDNIAEFQHDFFMNKGGDDAAICELRETPANSLKHMKLLEEITKAPTKEITLPNGEKTKAHVINDPSIFDI